MTDQPAPPKKLKKKKKKKHKDAARLAAKIAEHEAKIAAELAD